MDSNQEADIHNKRKIAVVFRSAKFCSWVIQKDRSHDYRLVAHRSDRSIGGEEADGTLLERSQEFRNAAPVFRPADDPEFPLLVDLWWHETFSPQEVWLFVYMRAVDAEHLATETGLLHRAPDFHAYVHDDDSTLNCFRLRSPHDVTVISNRLARSFCLEAVWIGFHSVRETAFTDFSLCEGADYFLFNRFARGGNLPTIFLGVDLLEGWRYTIKQDAWTHESGDPLFCFPNRFTADFDRYNENHFSKRGYTVYYSDLSEPNYIDFAKRGETASPK